MKEKKDFSSILVNDLRLSWNCHYCQTTARLTTGSHFYFTLKTLHAFIHLDATGQNAPFNRCVHIHGTGHNWTPWSAGANDHRDTLGLFVGAVWDFCSRLRCKKATINPGVHIINILVGCDGCYGYRVPTVRICCFNFVWHNRRGTMFTWKTIPSIHLGRRLSQKKASVTGKDGKGCKNLIWITSDCKYYQCWWYV